jgi:hypothetical protein
MIGRVFELFSCLDVKITTFELEKTNCGLLDYAFTFDFFEFWPTIICRNIVKIIYNIDMVEVQT